MDIASNRREIIGARLANGQAVSSSELATEFGVSEDAIRRDLRGLAAAGSCRRVYGGALPLVSGSVPMSVRTTGAGSQKRALADAVFAMIEPGRFLFLDNGSTNLAVAETLPKGLDLAVATNSIAIASTLAVRDDVQLFMVGGGVDPVIGGCVDGTALEAVMRLNIDLCLLGACTVSHDGGVSAFETADATFKRGLVARSSKSIVLVTNDKLDRHAPHRIIAVDAVDRLVVEHDAPTSATDALAAAGAAIHRASPHGARTRS